MTLLHPEFLGGPTSVTEHTILMTGPTGSGPEAAVRSISDVVATVTPSTGPDVEDPFRAGLSYGEILLDVDTVLRLHAREGSATSEEPQLDIHATGLVVFVPLDADDPARVAAAQLGNHVALVRRHAAVIALTRHQGADPRLVNRVSDAVMERFPAARIPLFTVDPWRRDQLGTVLLTVLAGVEFHPLLGTDIRA